MSKGLRDGAVNAAAQPQEWIERCTECEKSFGGTFVAAHTFEGNCRFRHAAADAEEG